MTTTWQAQDNETEPAVPFDLKKFLQAAAKTIKIETRDLEFEIKNLTGNALLKKQTTIIFAIKDSDLFLPICITDRAVIGRMDAESTEAVDIDLMPYGGREQGVSRRHAALYRHRTTMTLVDLDSSNGTYLNGVRLIPHQPRLLREGDEVRLGNMCFHISFDY